jgi:hypothetical protein
MDWNGSGSIRSRSSGEWQCNLDWIKWEQTEMDTSLVLLCLRLSLA